MTIITSPSSTDEGANETVLLQYNEKVALTTY